MVWSKTNNVTFGTNLCSIQINFILFHKFYKFTKLLRFLLHQRYNLRKRYQSLIIFLKIYVYFNIFDLITFIIIYFQSHHRSLIIHSLKILKLSISEPHCLWKYICLKKNRCVLLTITKRTCFCNAPSKVMSLYGWYEFICTKNKLDFFKFYFTTFWFKFIFKGSIDSFNPINPMKASYRNFVSA